MIHYQTEALKGEDLILKYRIYLPGNPDTKPGLIILLHGIGSNEEDLYRFADRFPPGFAVVAARAPYMLGPGRYAWFELGFENGERVINAEQAEKSRLVINTFINQLKDKYPVDRKKVFLGGFSQGGIMSYSVGLTFPQKLSGIFALSSRLLPEVRPLIKNTEELRALEIFIAHGKSDPVLPITYAREASALLQPVTGKITSREYAMDHTILDEEMKDLNDWILTKSA